MLKDRLAIMEGEVRDLKQKAGNLYFKLATNADNVYIASSASKEYDTIIENLLRYQVDIEILKGLINDGHE